MSEGFSLMETAWLRLRSGLGYAMTVTTLPTLERQIDYGARVRVGHSIQTITEDTLPGIERDYKLHHKIRLGTSFQSVIQDNLPPLERRIFPASAPDSGSAVHSIMETSINGISIQE